MGAKRMFNNGFLAWASLIISAIILNFIVIFTIVPLRGKKLIKYCILIIMNILIAYAFYLFLSIATMSYIVYFCQISSFLAAIVTGLLIPPIIVVLADVVSNKKVA